MKYKLKLGFAITIYCDKSAAPPPVIYLQYYDEALKESANGVEFFKEALREKLYKVFELELPQQQKPAPQQSAPQEPAVSPSFIMNFISQIDLDEVGTYCFVAAVMAAEAALVLATVFIAAPLVIEFHKEILEGAARLADWIAPQKGISDKLIRYGFLEAPKPIIPEDGTAFYHQAEL